MQNSDSIKHSLVAQITSRVRWRETIDYLIKAGVNQFVEIGPSKILSTLIKKTNEVAQVYSISDAQEIEELLKKFLRVIMF